MTKPAFWTDDAYDRENASDGVSRYGSYLRDVPFEPWTDRDRGVELAEWAWRLATPPVMAPGYVRRDHRILSARLERSDWDGKLTATVEVLASAPSGWRGARLPGDGHWRDWPTEWSFGADRNVFRDPSGEDLAGGGRYMLASAALVFALRCDLPGPPAEGQPDLGLCREVLALVIGELNEIVTPAIARIWGS